MNNNIIISNITIYPLIIKASVDISLSKSYLWINIIILFKRFNKVDIIDLYKIIPNNINDN